MIFQNCRGAFFFFLPFFLPFFVYSPASSETEGLVNNPAGTCLAAQDEMCRDCKATLRAVQRDQLQSTSLILEPRAQAPLLRQKLGLERHISQHQGLRPWIQELFFTYCRFTEKSTGSLNTEHMTVPCKYSEIEM